MPLRRTALIAHPRPMRTCGGCGKEIPLGERRLVPRYDSHQRRSILVAYGPCCSEPNPRPPVTVPQ